jgi:hypothetical protein
MLYTAKCYWPGLDAQQLERAIRKLLRRRVRGRRVSYLGSIVFPDDQLVLCLFDASSKAAVQQASERAGLPCERVMQSAWLTCPNSRIIFGQAG